VTANARSGLAALAASIVAAPIAAGIDAAAGAAWVLRVGTLIYLAAMVLALRLPDHVDLPSEPATPRPAPAQPVPAQRLPGQPARTLPLADPLALASPAPGQAGPPGQAAGPGGPWRTLRNVGPVVGEAMRGNATMRAFYGFTFFFLVFLLQTDHFHGVSRTFALGALVGVAAAGSLLGTALGAGLRSRSPHIMMFGMLALATLTTAVCAWFFGFGAALAVAFVSTLGTALSKLANDSIVQREIGEEIRSSTFAVSETLNQLSWVVGGLVGVGLSVTGSGPTGLGIAAAGLAAALVLLIDARRRRVRAARHSATPA
jgi:hypothetical protein